MPTGQMHRFHASSQKQSLERVLIQFSEEHIWPTLCLSQFSCHFHFALLFDFPWFKGNISLCTPILNPQSTP